MKRLILIMLMLVSVAACGPDIKNGRVSNKWDEPAHDTLSFLPISCGKACFMMIPIHVHHDEAFMVTVESQKCEHVDWSIPKEVWERVKVGMFIDDKYNLSDEPFPAPAVAAAIEKYCW